MNESYSRDQHKLNAHYVKQIKAAPILTHDEEYRLAKEWRDDGNKKAVESIISSHLRLVTKIASGYRGYGLPMSDLVSEGHVGMMQAMKNFDPEKGIRFSTYAMWWIRACIQEYILNAWSSVRMGTTSTQRRLFFNLKRTQREVSRFDNTHELTQDIIDKLSEKLGVKESEIRYMNQRMAGGDLSLNTPLDVSGERSSEWQDWLVDDRDNHEIELIQHDEITKRRQILSHVMESLTPREQEIFQQRRLADPPLSLDQVAKSLSLSRERIRQIEKKAFEKIQKGIKNYIVRDTQTRHHI